MTFECTDGHITGLVDPAEEAEGGECEGHLEIHQDATNFGDQRGDGSYGQFETISVHNPTPGATYLARVLWHNEADAAWSCGATHVDYGIAISGKDWDGQAVLLEYHVGTLSGLNSAEGCTDDDWVFIYPEGDPHEIGQDEIEAEEADQ